MVKKYAEFLKKTEHKITFGEYKNNLKEFNEITGAKGERVSQAGLDRLERYLQKYNKKIAKVKWEIALSYYELKKEIQVVDDTQPKRITDPFQAYYEHLKASRSGLTVLNYKLDIEQFRGVIDKHPKDVGIKEIDIFYNMLASKYSNRNTVVRKLRAVKSFFDYLRSRDYISTDPFRSIDIGSPAPVISEGIDDSLVVKLFKAVRELPETETNIMIGAILALLDSGARKKEILGLRVDDINDSGEFEVTLKGGRSGTYVIPNQNLDLIDRWIEYRKKIVYDSDRLFIHKGTYKYSELSSYYLYKLLYGFQKKVIGVKINPHAFRHHLVDLLDESKASLKEIQEAGNWLSPSTALRYISRKQNKVTIKKYHPRG